MATLRSRCGYYIFVLFLSSFFFLSSPNLNGRRLDIYHTSTHGVDTWCGPSANLECRSEMWSGHHGTTLSRWIFATKASINNRKKSLLNSNISCTCPHNIANFGQLGWDLLPSLGHPGKFQRVLHLGFVTAATSFMGGQPNFARCLAVSWADTLYIYIFRALAPWRNFATCKIHFVSKSCVLLY